MTKKEMNDKYVDFLNEISKILGLGRPVDIFKLCATTDLFFQPLEKRIAELEKENAELKTEVGSSIDCEKAQKNGELCLGYSGDEDEPCERCKNCIKCEGGYYQLGETEKDEQLTKAKEILEDIIKFQPYIDRDAMFLTRGNDWKEVIFKAEQSIKDSEVEK